MLIFIDESGDSGLKVEKGSSKFFVVSLVIFEEDEEAIACDSRIELLRKEIGWNPKDEFHFKNNSHRVKEKFLNAVSGFNFFYYGVVMDKKRLPKEVCKTKDAFYKYSCGLVFENARERLSNARIVIDQSGSNEFKKQLERYLKSKVNSADKKVIKNIKMQKSNSNNLLQLADYIAGVINRSIHENKKDAKKFRKLISHREIEVEIWPKI